MINYIQPTIIFLLIINDFYLSTNYYKKINIENNIKSIISKINILQNEINIVNKKNISDGKKNTLINILENKKTKKIDILLDLKYKLYFFNK